MTVDQYARHGLTVGRRIAIPPEALFPGYIPAGQPSMTDVDGYARVVAVRTAPGCASAIDRLVAKWNRKRQAKETDR